MFSALLAIVVLPGLVFFWLRPRTGLPVALGAALVTSLVEGTRYAMSWVAILLFAIAVDAVVRRSAERSLQGAAREHPRRVAAATSLLGLAVWVRLEYLVLVLAWIVVVWVAGGVRRRPPLAATLPPLLVGLVPHVVVLVAGGPRHFWWWGSYAAFGFRDYRALPKNWDLPFDYLQAVFGGGGDLADLRLQMASYFCGALMVLAAAVLLLRRRGVRRDPTNLAPFLTLAGAIVLYAQSVRYHGQNGIQAVGLLVPGFLALAFTARWVRPLVVVVLLLITAVPVFHRIDVPGTVGDARAFWRANGAHEPIDRLRRAGISDDVRPSVAVLPSLWRRFTGDSPTGAVVNRRNDDPQVNEAFLYWYLGIRPAIWPVTYDPGLADDGPVVAEELRDLCAKRPPVVQFREAWAIGFGRHGDQRLDPYLALNYRLAGDGDLYRVLVARPGPCLDPTTLPLARLHARRDALLATDDLPAAQAVALAAVDRSGRADPADALLTVLSDRRIPDGDVPAGGAGTLVRAIQDGPIWPGLPAFATDPAQPPIVRLAAMIAFARQAAAFPDDAKRAVLGAAYTLLGEHPDWVALADVVRAFQPPADSVFADIRRLGVRATWLRRWVFDTHAAAGDPRAIAEGRGLLRTYGERAPLQAAAVLQALAPVFQASGDTACADAVLARADAVPGVDPGPYEGRPTACAALDG